ncbi:Recombinase [Lachnobacterium bovis]|uniref:Recombinase n=1 Tax=Lachnobacterium bovis TaxID=140626 RepID=A0A1H9UYT2_9FIRM|nr:Recombinase [Lachnobacterium bovis]
MRAFLVKIYRTGREQKAREGRWNGGFAPYGYKLENGELVIADDEVDIIKLIYDRYIHTDFGINGVASYLNNHGYTKKLRLNNTIAGFSSSFVKNVLDNPDHAHILSGILKCPCCGKSLYGNIAKAHSKDKKTRYYYYCKNTLGKTGHKCTFRLNIEQKEMNNLVASIISAMVNDKRFKEAIKVKIGTAVDTEALEKQREALCGQLKQAMGTKSRLANQMDNLDIDDIHYDRKIADLQSRYDDQYDIIEELEGQIDKVQEQIQSIMQENLSSTSIYQLLLAFDKFYNDFNEAEQKEFMRAFIDRIDIYQDKPTNGCWIKNIVFNFPVPINGKDIRELSLENETMLETVCLLSKLSEAKHHI